jgi:MFS family permease
MAGHRRLLLGRERVPRTVVLLGLTSLFTDISSEMVATILPLFLVAAAGFTPLQYGIVDGIYGGATALVRIAGGFAGDRLRRHKQVAALGYGLSAACKPAFLFVSSVPGISALVLVDRAGKGVRTAPRDAMISLSSAPSELGASFGVHRALDTTGAMLGPLVAFVLLALTPGSFDSIFVVSFCFALIGLGILVLLVDGQPGGSNSGAVKADPGPNDTASLREALTLLGQPTFARILGVGAVFALFTVSEGFLFLGLQRQLDLDISFFPLLFVGVALVYMVLAVPVGRLADKVGRGRVLVSGYVLLLLAYTSLLAPIPAGVVPLYLILLGAYHAATDGVLMAIASSVVPNHVRGSGLAFVLTGMSVAGFTASVVFGALWTAWGIDTAAAVFMGGLAVGIVFSAIILRTVDHAWAR